MGEKLRVGGRYWLPPLLWMSLVLALSTNSFSGEQTGGILERVLGALWPALLRRLDQAQIEWVNFAIRKLAHLTEYAILAFLWSRGFTRAAGRPGRAGILRALLVTTATAVVDEAHQASCAERTGTIADVLLDGMGAVVGGVMYHVWERRHAKCPTSASLSSS